MTKEEAKKRAEWILDEVGKINPYRRQRANDPRLYYIYQMGYLASFLGSLMEQDSHVKSLFKQQLND